MLNAKISGLICAMLCAWMLAGCMSESDLLHPWNQSEWAGGKRDQLVKGNIRLLMVAVESYSIDHSGKHPTSIDELKRCVPANGFLNPFTQKYEWPTMGNITDIQAVRNAPPQKMESGSIQYSSIRNGESFAIIGGNHWGHAFSQENNPKLTIVWSIE